MRKKVPRKGTVTLTVGNRPTAFKGDGMEILQTIALLCQINGNGSPYFVSQKQLECQQYYITCLANNNLSTYKDLSKCVQTRKL